MEHLLMTAPEAPDVPAPTTALGAGPGFVVQLDAFNGPLDLLLHLLREEQIEIADIPITRIADQFLLAIHELGLNQAADYLDMASRLVRLKAQMLLPRRSEEDGWEDPRAELVRRLLEYQQIREIAVWMGRSAERRAGQYARATSRRHPSSRRHRWRSTCSSCCRRWTGSSRRSRHRCSTGWLPGRSTSRPRPAASSSCSRSGSSRLARGAGPAPDDRGCALHPAGAARAGQAGHPSHRATGRLRADGDRP
jgi:Uncharacterized conserved protein